jgi:hypothetical protein
MSFARFNVGCGEVRDQPHVSAYRVSVRAGNSRAHPAKEKPQGQLELR